MSKLSSKTEDKDDSQPLLPQGVDDTPPKDRYNIIYIIFFLQGVGVLFPWNAFITVTQYFASRLQGSRYEATFENFFTFGFQVSNILCLLVAMKYQQRISIRKRIVVPLVLQLGVFSATTALTKVDLSQGTFFISTLVLVLVSGSATAFLQGALFGLAGSLPFRYTQALMSGQGLGGLIVALLNVATIAVWNGQDLNQSAFMFFLVSVAVIVLCIAGYEYMIRLPFVHYYLDRAKLSAAQARVERADAKEPPLIETWRKVQRLALTVGLNFMITLAVFPSITASVVSRHTDAYSATYFIPVYCFVGFNLGDLIGRSLAGWKQWPGMGNAKLLTYPVLMRTLFIVLFLLMPLNLGPGLVDHASVVFKNDAWAYIFMLLFAITNGYFGSLCMMFGPSLVDHHQADSAGAMMVLALTVGLGLGTLVGFGLKAALCLCNPFEDHSTNATALALSASPAANYLAWGM